MATATPDGGVGEVQRCQGTEGQRDIWPGHAASSFHGRKVVQLRAEREPRAPRKTRRAYKQSHVASGRRGGRAKSRRLFRQQRDGAAARDKYCARAAAQHSQSQEATFPNACAPVSARIPAPTQDPQPSTLVDPLLSRSPPASFPSIFPTRRIPWASQAGSWLSIRPVRRSRPRSVPCRSLGRTGGPRARAG